MVLWRAAVYKDRLLRPGDWLKLALVRRMRNAAESRFSLARDGLPPTRPEGACSQPAWAPADLRWPLKVAVLIDLEWSERAGGHVKSWERLAEAATRLPELVDLTVHLHGRTRRVVTLAENVRFATHRPVFSTAMMLARSSVPDHTDLAPIHPSLLRELWDYDVIHTTDAHFAYARTARLAARLSGTALVHSVHTEIAGYTRLYSERLLRRLPAFLARPLIQRLQLPNRFATRMDRRLERHLRACDKVLLSARSSAARRTGLAGGSQRTGVLRRGIDREAFSPRHRDRDRLQATYGIPPERAVLMFAGRVEQGKNVMTLAAAARQLIERGLDVAVLVAGEGSERRRVQALLGDRAVLPGNVDPHTLAWLYASADLFVFPSRIEESPNVVLEAKASGVPPLVAPGGGDVFIAIHGADGFVVAETTPEAWAQVIGELVASPGWRAVLGRAARLDVEKNRPSWDDVLAEDLIPVWQAAVARHAYSPATPQRDAKVQAQRVR